jgi:hypothetical protein
LVTKRSPKPRVGDCFAIPLKDGGYAFCQYIAWNAEMGFLVRVFDVRSRTILTADQLRGKPPMFPPVFVGLRATLRSGRWKAIGNFGVEPFEFPRFRQTLATSGGVYHDWRIWDGSATRFVGELPPEDRNLELLCTWGDEALEERILTREARGDKLE